VKIGPVDTEMALLIVKKEEITEGKIYSPAATSKKDTSLQSTACTYETEANNVKSTPTS